MAVCWRCGGKTCLGGPRTLGSRTWPEESSSPGNGCSTMEGLLQGSAVDLNGLSQIRAVGEILPEPWFLNVCIKKRKRKKKGGGESSRCR